MRPLKLARAWQWLVAHLPPGFQPTSASNLVAAFRRAAAAHAMPGTDAREFVLTVSPPWATPASLFGTVTNKAGGRTWRSRRKQQRARGLGNVCPPLPPTEGLLSPRLFFFLPASFWSPSPRPPSLSLSHTLSQVHARDLLHLPERSGWGAGNDGVRTWRGHLEADRARGEDSSVVHRLEPHFQARHALGPGGDCGLLAAIYAAAGPLAEDYDRWGGARGGGGGGGGF